MNVCVAGLWHLGTVTAACLASAGHDVVGLDEDAARVSALSQGAAPLFEPGLDDAVKRGLASGHLRFTTDPAGAAGAADIVWITIDTPVDDDDRADVESVVARAAGVFRHLRDGALVLISSQVPVGTTRRLEQLFAAETRGRRVTFGYSPENLRLGNAIRAFTQPDRVVVGVRAASDRERVERLLEPFTRSIEWMSVESAEMTKHALNAFLATSVTFINEVATLCEAVGADAADVERGLKSEVRIGPKAYLSPGAAFAGGTLARDVTFLADLGHAHGAAVPLLSAIGPSNARHQEWAQRRLDELLGGVAGKAIAVWGLTYKPGTDTLRRSSSIALCRWLIERGAGVHAHDPVVKRLPDDLAARVALAASPLAAVDGASALVVSTPWPVYREIPAADVLSRMARGLVIDANRVTGETLGRAAGVDYVSVGRSRIATS